MSLVIISQNEAGGVSITSPSADFTAQQILDKGSLGNFARIVSVDSLPDKPEFTDAWEMDATSISVNFTKAQQLTKVRLRAERAPLLAAQDIAFMKAQETGASITEIVAEKNRLRDVTKLVDTATTLEELLALNCEK